jgi:hypothetical protein
MDDEHLLSLLELLSDDILLLGLEPKRKMMYLTRFQARLL